MVTIKEIADQAGVSATTVSNVLHNKRAKVSQETLQKIQNLLEKNNYIPRLGLSALTNKKSRIICVLINTPPFAERTAYERPFYGNVIGNLEKMLREKGYYIMIFSDKNVEEIEKMAVGWNADGIISISMPYRHYKKISELSNKPIVSIDMDEFEEKDEGCCYNVTSEDETGGKMMGDYLIRKGIKRIVYLFNATHGADHNRYIGLRHAVVSADSGAILESIQLPSDYAGREKVYENVLKYVNTDTALFFSTDLNAAESISFFQKSGVRVPDEISVVGFDDDIYASLVYPRITTVRVEVSEKAEKAVEVLTDLIDGKELRKQTYKTKTVIVERQSVKKEK